MLHWHLRRRVDTLFEKNSIRPLVGNRRSITSQNHAPITVDQFKKMLEACIPSGRWPTKLGDINDFKLPLAFFSILTVKQIAVAFSGGPDSTCLLYLLKQLLLTEDRKGILPKELLAITIDHGLQAESEQTAAHCAALSKSIQVTHMTLRIPWSIPPFPKLPEKGRAFEDIARRARYHLLFDAMQRENTGAIAFGHHADDQVETSLLRIARGSSEIGAGGMRACRRWGMGFGDGPGALGWAGHAGMNKWIIRPFLSISKDQILMTCGENGLKYVDDPTNFQPNLTPRNAVRYTLKRDSGSKISEAETVVEDALKAEDAEKRLLSYASPELDSSFSRMERLRHAVKSLSARVEYIDEEVTTQLQRCVLLSPISTLILSAVDISQITDNSIRLAMVLRILRYISPEPWGSVRAEAKRRSASLQQIVDRVWGFDAGAGRALTGGGGVIWTPIAIRRSGGVRFRPARLGEKAGWMASRQPPKDIRALDLDVTHRLASAMQTKSEVEVLFDNRFLLHIRPHVLPHHISGTLAESYAFSSFHVQSDGRYYLPIIIWRWGRRQDICLTSMTPSGSLVYGQPDKTGKNLHISDLFARITPIRSLDTDGPSTCKTVVLPTTGTSTGRRRRSW